MTKRVLMLVASKKKRIEYLTTFLNNAKAGDIAYDQGSLEELSFVIGDEGVSIKNHTGVEVSDYDLVVFRTVGRYKKEAVALAHYCDGHGVRYIDSIVGTIAAIDDENKLGEMVVLRLAGLPVPDTVYASNLVMREYANKIGYPIILKSIDGKKGRDNYYVKSQSELGDILENTAAGGKMLMQRFIPNNQDYRVLCLSYHSTVVTLRKRVDSATHLNNVSAGGIEVLANNDDAPVDVLDVSLAAAKVLAVEVAGVDVVVDENSRKPYIMEVNRAPELTLEKEYEEYFKSLSSMSES